MSRQVIQASVPGPQPGNSLECVGTSWCCPDSPERGSASLRCAEVPLHRCARAQAVSPGACSGCSPSRTPAPRRPNWTTSPSWAGSRSCLRLALVAVRGAVATTTQMGRVSLNDKSDWFPVRWWCGMVWSSEWCTTLQVYGSTLYISR